MALGLLEVVSLKPKRYRVVYPDAMAPWAALLLLLRSLMLEAI